MKCFLVTGGVAVVRGRHPLHRECVTLRVLTHRWLVRRLEEVAVRQRVDLDEVVQTAIEEMLTVHDD